jgi:hypothetical protein
MPWGRTGSEAVSSAPAALLVLCPAGNYYDIKCVDVDGDTYTLWQIYIDNSGFRWNVSLSDMD